MVGDANRLSVRAVTLQRSAAHTVIETAENVVGAQRRRLTQRAGNTVMFSPFCSAGKVYFDESLMRN